MQWPEYKIACDRPDVWSRWMLEQCIEIFDQLNQEELSAWLSASLQTEPLTRPVDHRGGEQTNMYVLTLQVEQRDRCLHAIKQAVATGISSEASAERGLGGFVEAWQEYSTANA